MKFTGLIQKFPKVFQTYWDLHWPKGKVLFRLVTGEPLADVRTIFSPKPIPLKTFFKNDQNPDPFDASTSDKTALSCLRWVVGNIAYQTDQETYDRPEYWQKAEKTVQIQKGDCEDMAILLSEMMRSLGIPAWRRKIACGLAQAPSGEMVGHAYVLYLTDDFVWTTLDAAYYPMDSINEFGIPHSKLRNYGELWFTFNEVNSWHQKSTLFMY